jgi:hypothetical protein
MTQETGPARHRLAYRRAGCAVARHIQGTRPEALSLEGQAPAGTPRRGWQVDLGGGARHRIELDLLALWVGLLAEARSAGEAGGPPDGWGPALEPLAEAARRVTRTEGENAAYLEWLRQRALGLLDLPGIWPAIETVAEALAEKGRLEGRDVAGLIALAPRPRRGFAGWGTGWGGTR